MCRTEVFASVGAERVELDELLAASQLVAVCVPPNPSSRGMIDARRVALIPKGSILVLITRAAPVDMEAVRRRVLTDDLFLGADVFDVEPPASRRRPAYPPQRRALPTHRRSHPERAGPHGGPVDRRLPALFRGRAA